MNLLPEGGDGGDSGGAVVGADLLADVAAPKESALFHQGLLLRGKVPLFLGDGRETAGGVRPRLPQTPGRTGPAAGSAADAPAGRDFRGLRREVGDDGPQKEPGAVDRVQQQPVFPQDPQPRPAGGVHLPDGGIVHEPLELPGKRLPEPGAGSLQQLPGHPVVVGNDGVAGEVPPRELPYIIRKAAGHHRLSVLGDPGEGPALQQGQAAFKGHRPGKGDARRLQKGPEPVHFRRSRRHHTLRRAAWVLPSRIFPVRTSSTSWERGTASAVRNSPSSSFWWE